MDATWNPLNFDLHLTIELEVKFQNEINCENFLDLNETL
jgi:hypothetical protein